MTHYLTAEQVLFLHARLIQETGGVHGVRDAGLLASAVARPKATFGGDELYPDVFFKCAALMESLIRNHAFMDGNKRTAITASGIFLLRNGYRLKTTNAEMEAFTLRVTIDKPDLPLIAQWFLEHSAPVIP